MHSLIKMRAGKNICSFCNCSDGKFYHLEESIRAPNDLSFGGHTDLQAVLEKILNKNGKYKKAPNEICQKCRDKLHGIYSFTHQHTEADKIFHQITDVTVRLKKFSTFFMLTDLKTEFEAIAETDKDDKDSPKYSWTVADIECDDSVVSKVVVKNEFGNNCEGTDFSEVTNVGFLEGECSNAADGRSVEQKKIDCVGNAESEQITIEEEIIKEEWTMQEGEIFEGNAKRDVLYREQTKFSCNICDEVFTTASCLTKHMKIAHESGLHDFNQADGEHNTKENGHTQRPNTKKDIACDQCDAKFINKRSLWAHKKTHLEIALKCNICDQYFHSKHALGDHKRTHCVALLECDMCDAEFKYKSNLEKHKLSHTNEFPGSEYYCCNTKFTVNASLRHHRLSRICKSCKCVQCDVKLNNKKSLRRHLIMVHPIKNFYCDQCEKKYKYLRSLKLHIKLSHDGVEFKCDQCDATYKSKQSFEVHRLIHSGISLTCDQCGVTYKSKHYLNKHKLIHSGITFNCDQCDATYKSKQYLNMHKLKHSGISFNCDQCDATYKSKQYLKVHKQIHSGITFNCDQCDAKYKTSRGLTDHKNLHTGVNLRCNKCDVTFSNKGSFKNHLRYVHTDTVLSCDHCDASYKSKQGLNMHKRIHTGILLNCDQCDAKYTTSGGLRYHKKSHGTRTL